MIFWSCELKEGEPYALKKFYPKRILHITNAALIKRAKAGKSYLMITRGIETFTIGMLKKDQVDKLRLDLYVNEEDNIRLSLSGPGEVQLLGYFEKNVK